MEIDLIFSLIALLLTGIAALGGAIAFILKYVESIRTNLVRSIEQVREEHLRQLDRLESGLRAAIDVNKKDSIAYNESIRKHIDALRREVEDKISRANYRIEKNKDKIYKHFFKSRK